MRRFPLFILFFLIGHDAPFSQVIPRHSAEIIIHLKQGLDSALFSGGAVLISRGYTMRQLSDENYLITTAPREIGHGLHLQVKISAEKHDSTELHVSGILLYFRGQKSVIRTIAFEGSKGPWPEAWNELCDIAREIPGGRISYASLKHK